MNIAALVLRDQYEYARQIWPFIDSVNERYGLPRLFLYAVGSRETNMTNERGDGGHGHGVFQLDDRFHVIPPGFDEDVQLQAMMAASMLAALYSSIQDWRKVANAYNSGQTEDQYTAGGDYGPDVMGRLAYLQSVIPLTTRRRREPPSMRYEPTPVPEGHKRGDLPGADWVAYEYVLPTPGPVGGWPGRILAHTVFGFGGACIQEAWWGDGHAVTHTVTPDHPFQVGQFVPVVWEAPPGSRFLVVRVATASFGGTQFETER